MLATLWFTYCGINHVECWWCTQPQATRQMTEEKWTGQIDLPSRLPEVGEIEVTAEVKVKVTEPEASPLLGTRTLTGWGPLGPTDIVHSSDVEECDVTVQSAPPTVTSLLEPSNPVPLMVTTVPWAPAYKAYAVHSERCSYVHSTIIQAGAFKIITCMCIPYRYRYVYSTLIQISTLNIGTLCALHTDTTSLYDIASTFYTDTNNHEHLKQAMHISHWYRYVHLTLT